MSKLQKGQDILRFWDNTGTRRFGYQVGDLISKGKRKYLLTTDTTQLALQLVPIDNVDSKPLQVSINTLEREGYKVVGNTKDNPLIGILYGNK